MEHICSINMHGDRQASRLHDHVKEEMKRESLLE